MEFGLKGRHVAILAADGVEESQLESSRKALTDAGMAADVVGARQGEVKTASGKAVTIDRTFEVCHAADYDALVIPGGSRAANALASEQRALQFVREFMAADKPVAAIAEGVRLLAAADTLAGRGISVEVIDPRTIVPLDMETILGSLRKTMRLAVAHDAHKTGGFGAEIAARIMEEAFDYLEAPVVRVTGYDTPYPPATLEEHYLPTPERIARAVRRAIEY